MEEITPPVSDGGLLPAVELFAVPGGRFVVESSVVESAVINSAVVGPSDEASVFTGRVTARKLVASVSGLSASVTGLRPGGESADSVDITCVTANGAVSESVSEVSSVFCFGAVSTAVESLAAIVVLSKYSSVVWSVVSADESSVVVNCPGESFAVVGLGGVVVVESVSESTVVSVTGCVVEGVSFVWVDADAVSDPDALDSGSDSLSDSVSVRVILVGFCFLIFVAVADSVAVSDDESVVPMPDCVDVSVVSVDVSVDTSVVVESDPDVELRRLWVSALRLVVSGLRACCRFSCITTHWSC